MNERRQRVVRAGVIGLVVLSGLASVSGCGARTSVEGAQTAITAAQTAIPAAQAALPAIQATAQAGATSVAGIVSDAQAVSAQLQLLLAGSSVDLKTAPPGAANDAITDVTINATDSRGTLAQLDAASRQAAASAAMIGVAQYYPRASISVTVRDAAGATLVSGTKPLGQAPAFQ